ncbi:MAG: acetolactate synthase II small subunit [Moritella sp.]|jgi:acetolactate synthase II small subunit
MSGNKQNVLVIKAHDQPEILERILRVIRHRGFRVSAMNMAQMNDCNTVKVTVTVSSERPIDFLYKQLDKLFDVIDVQYQCGEKI